MSSYINVINIIYTRTQVNNVTEWNYNYNNIIQKTKSYKKGTYPHNVNLHKLSHHTNIIRIFCRAQNYFVFRFNPNNNNIIIIVHYQFVIFFFFYAHTVTPVSNTGLSLRFTTVWNRSLSRLHVYSNND